MSEDFNSLKKNLLLDGSTREIHLIQKISNLPFAHSNNTLLTAASFLVTESCNLACKYCFEKSKSNTMTPEVAKQAVRFLFKNASKTIPKEIVNINLFGGEPTRRPDIIKCIFDECIKCEKEFNTKFIVSMITNCTIMNKKLYNLFKDYKDKVNFEVQLSIDGDEYSQNLYRVDPRGKGSFDRVLKVIPYYLELFKNTPQKISVHGCLNKKTISELYHNYIFFREVIGIERIWFLPVCEENWDTKDVETYEQQLGYIWNYIKKHIDENNTLFELKNYAPLDRCLMKGKPDKPCGAGVNYCSITANGDIYPCHQMYYHEAGEKEMLIGNVFTGDDIERRRLFLDYDDLDMSCPSDCTHPRCYRCIAVNWSLYRTILTQHRGYYCDLMKIDEQFQVMIREYCKEKELYKEENRKCHC